MDPETLRPSERDRTYEWVLRKNGPGPLSVSRLKAIAMICKLLQNRVIREAESRHRSRLPGSESNQIHVQVFDKEALQDKKRSNPKD